MWALYKCLEDGTKKNFSFKNGTIPPIIIKKAEIGKSYELIDPKFITVEDKDSIKTQLVGFAILREDPNTHLKYFDTYDKDGKGFTQLSPQQPLVFPVEKLAVGTKVELYFPEENNVT